MPVACLLARRAVGILDLLCACKEAHPVERLPVHGAPFQCLIPGPHLNHTEFLAVSVVVDSAEKYLLNPRLHPKL